MLSVEFPQVQYIDLGAIVYVLKAVAIVSSAHSYLMIFVANHVLGAKTVPWMGMNLDFGTHKKSPFPLKRGVSSIKQVTNTKIMITFIRDKNFVSPEWGRGPKEEFPPYYYY